MGCGNAISLASKYDLKKIIPLLITIFERLNPSIQVEVVASIDGLLIEEEEKTNMFGVEASMERIFMGIGYWGNVFVLEVGYTPIMCAWIHVWWKTHEGQFLNVGFFTN
jgi:hypothetical protein